MSCPNPAFGSDKFGRRFFRFCLTGKGPFSAKPYTRFWITVFERYCPDYERSYVWVIAHNTRLVFGCSPASDLAPMGGIRMCDAELIIALLKGGKAENKERHLDIRLADNEH